MVVLGFSEFDMHSNAQQLNGLHCHYKFSPHQPRTKCSNKKHNISKFSKEDHSFYLAIAACNSQRRFVVSGINEICLWVGDIYPILERPPHFVRRLLQGVREMGRYHPIRRLFWLVILVSSLGGSSCAMAASEASSGLPGHAEW